MQIAYFSTARVALAALLLGSALHAANGGGANGTTQRVSLSSAGLQVFAASSAPSLSRDGQRVAFQTSAALVPADTNGIGDIYVHDRANGTVSLVSTTVGGGLLNGASRNASISGDGLWVAFETDASNAIGFDLNGNADVLLKNLATGAVERVSSPVGSLFAASGASRRPHLSGDGRFVAFHSNASNLAFNDTNAVADVFVRELWLGVTSPASRIPGGARERS